MSFEFEVVGDFLGVGKLVWDVYVAYTDAPEQFRNFSQEILSLHVVFAQVKDQLQNTPTGSLSTKDTHNLTVLYHGLKTTMEELDTLLKKYREDSVRLRDKLRSNLALLTTFNSSLANCQLAQQRAQLVGIQTQLGQILKLDKGANIDAMAKNGACTTLPTAARDGDTEIAKLLWGRGIEIDTMTDYKWTALHCAANHGHPETVKMLLERGAAIDATTDDKSTALHLAAYNNHPKTVKMLLEMGAAIDATTNSKWTALHWAAHNGQLETVKMLLERGAAIDATTNDKWTALHLAAKNGHRETIKVLLEWGTVIDATTDSK